VPGFTYDAESHRYLDADGKPVPPSAVRKAIDAVGESASARAREAGDAFAAGEINDAEMRLKVRAEVKAALTAATAAAAGGWRQTTSADWSEAGRRASAIYAELDDLLRKFHNGEATGAQLAAWAAALPKLARGAYEAIRGKRAEGAGMDEARRVLAGGAVKHCEECIDEADKDWQPIDDLLPIGDCTCLMNCLCEVEYRRSGEAEAGAEGPETTDDEAGAPSPPPQPPPVTPPPPPADSFADLAARLAAATRPSDARQIALDWVAAHAAPGDPTPVQAHGMPAPEAMRTVRVGGLTIRFPDLGDRTQSAVADTVRGLARLGDLPPELTRYTREIVLATGRNKDDAHWELQYGMADFRAMATGGSGGKVVVYNGKPVNGGDLAHEMAHNLATGRWDSTIPPARTDYAAAIRSGEPPVSPYAAKSPAEDFAEAVRLYTENPGKLREIAPKRFEVIERMLREPFYGG
jgi:hypothetical protein